MNQLTVLYSFPSRIGTVGIGMTAWHQVAGLIAQGVRVHLYTGSCEKELKGLSSLHQTMVVCGVKIPYRLISQRRVWALHDKIVARALRHFGNKLEIVHCWPSGALETLRTARELGIRTVLERPNTHTEYAMKVVQQECAKLGLKLPRSNSHAFSASRLNHEVEEFNLADYLLCPSDFVAQTFLEKDFPKTKILRHRYGFDPARFKVFPADSVNFNQRPFSIVFVGGCEPRKGLHFALDAWLASKASSCGVFYICGKYVPGYRELLADRLAHPSIKEVGFLTSVNTLMQQCHALVLPTIEEGSALVTYEARACGCVLLVSNASGAVCEHNKNALVHTAGDVATLRDHIDMLASDSALFARLRKNSLDSVSELTWDKAAESLVKAYKECLNER